MVGSLAHSGRVIFAAGAVMVAVFFTFALSGPLPPKEMGIVLGVAVLLDAFLVRLVLLPVLLRLTGEAAWWAPAWLTPRPARHPLLPRLTRRHPDERRPPCAEQSGASTCGKTTWGGCGRHVAQVKAACPRTSGAPGTPPRSDRPVAVVATRLTERDAVRLRCA